MRKGLTLTLMTVLMTVFCLNAMAEAPVISGLKDIVVGDENEATPANLFVFPDAVNLDTKVSDPEDDPITWSFVDLTGRYLINGKASGEDIVGASVTGDDDESVDTDLATITVRDGVLSPIGGPNVAPDPDVAGLVIAEGTIVTLIASDGSTETQAEIFIYTDNEGNDRLSPAGVFEDHQEWAFSSTTNNGWTQATFISGNATMAMGADGMCITVDTTTDEDGWWKGPYGETNGISFVNNAVYRVRLTMTTTATGAEEDPLWDFTFENQAEGGTAGSYVYGGDLWYFAQLGGANSISSMTDGGVAVFDIYYAPACIAVTDWISAAGDSANDANNDMRMSFRVTDWDNAGYEGALEDYGQICVQSINVDRADFSSLDVPATPAWDGSDMTAAAYTVSDLVNGSSATYASGDLTLEASTSGWDTELVYVDPGDSDFSNSAAYVDNYPVVWEANKLYMLEVELQAASAAGEANPVDYINFMVDTASNELFSESFITSNLNGAAMPKLAASSKYYSFLNGLNVSASADTNFARIRGHLVLGNDINVFGKTHDDSDLKVLGLKVYALDIQD